MALRREQEDLYRKTLGEVKRQIDEIDDQVETEIQRVKARLAELQESKKSLSAVYKGMARLLGEDVDLGEEDETRTPTQHLGKTS